MSKPFLVWPNDDDAKDSLIAVNAMYGCPLLLGNGYRMDRWDTVGESETSNNAGFYKPEERMGKEMDDLMDVLEPGFIEYEEKPIDFFPEEV